MDSLKVTWIAPEVEKLPKLEWISEIGGIGGIEGVNLKVVAGPDVTRTQISHALRQRNDITIWSGHGTPGGLAMPDGSLIRPKWLAVQTRCAVPHVIVLAACGSQLRGPALQSMVEEVSRQGINGIGFPASTDDAAAIMFTTELVRAFSAGASVGSAFDVAMESVSSTATAEGIFLVPGLTNGYRDVVVRLETLEAGQTELQVGMRMIMDHLGVENNAASRRRAARAHKAGV